MLDHKNDEKLEISGEVHEQGLPDPKKATLGYIRISNSFAVTHSKSALTALPLCRPVAPHVLVMIFEK